MTVRGHSHLYSALAHFALVSREGGLITGRNMQLLHTADVSLLTIQRCARLPSALFGHTAPGVTDSALLPQLVQKQSVAE